MLKANTNFKLRTILSLFTFLFILSLGRIAIANEFNAGDYLNENRSGNDSINFDKIYGQTDIIKVYLRDRATKEGIVGGSVQVLNSHHPNPFFTDNKDGWYIGHREMLKGDTTNELTPNIMDGASGLAYGKIKATAPGYETVADIFLFDAKDGIGRRITAYGTTSTLEYIPLSKLSNASTGSLVGRIVLTDSCGQLHSNIGKDALITIYNESGIIVASLLKNQGSGVIDSAGNFEFFSLFAGQKKLTALVKISDPCDPRLGLDDSGVSTSNFEAEVKFTIETGKTTDLGTINVTLRDRNYSVEGRDNMIYTIFGKYRRDKNILNVFTGDLYAWALGVAIAIATLIIVYAGIMYVTSGGNPDSIKNAKQWIYGALISLALIILSKLIFTTLGVKWFR